MFKLIFIRKVAFPSFHVSQASEQNRQILGVSQKVGIFLTPVKHEHDHCPGLGTQGHVLGAGRFTGIHKHLR